MEERKGKGIKGRQGKETGQQREREERSLPCLPRQYGEKIEGRKKWKGNERK